MKYTFDSVMHCSFSFSIDAKSYDEALEKTKDIKREFCCEFLEFPDVCLGETELHLCYVEEFDEDNAAYNRIGIIDEYM